MGAVLVGTGLVVLITSQGANTAAKLAASNPQTQQANTLTVNSPNNVANNQQPPVESDGLNLSLSELGLFDGKGEKACYVAVESIVYEIAGSSLWKDGVHTIAGRDITCGKDLTDEMKGAPHGLSKLGSQFVTEVGQLK